MSRVDVPTIKCDRCGDTTDVLGEMSRYQSLTHYSIGGSDDWDLCPNCWHKFIEFTEGN